MIEVGGIYLLAVTFTRPPKDKFCLCATADPWLFLVNSELNRFIEDRPDLRAQQVTLPRAGHPFLRQDSWIDCSDPCSIAASDIERQLAADPSRFKGMANQSVLRAVLLTVAASRTLPQRKKDRITDALRPLLVRH